MNKISDIAIVGAGPIGLSIAIAAARKRIDYLVLEKSMLVHSIYHFPTNMTFFSTATELELGGLPFICQGQKPTRAEALQYYRRVAQYFDLNIRYDAHVMGIEKDDGYFSLLLKSGEKVRAKNTVLASGYYDHPNLLNVPGENLPKVSHYYKESHLYFAKKVVVIGGRNSAAEAALEIYRTGGEVTLVHRGSGFDDKVKYWVRPDIENRIARGEIKAYFNSNVVKIEEKSVTIRTENGELLTIENDCVLALIGYHPDVDLMRRAGVRVDDETLVPQHNPETLETNVAGLYVAGALTVGREANKVFIENGRLHGEQVVTAIAKKLAS